MMIPKDRSPDLEGIRMKNQNPKEDICKALQCLNIQEDGNKKLPVNIKCENKNESNDDVTKLSEKLSDVKIEGDKENCLSQKVNCAKNAPKIVESLDNSDNSDKETKVQNVVQSIKHTELSERTDLQHTSSDEEEEQIQHSSQPTSENETEKDINVNKVKEVKKKESKGLDKVKEPDDLCCRAPLRNNLYRQHGNQPVYSRSHQSGGTVVVAESTFHREQSLNIPFPSQNCQNHNIIAEESLLDISNLQTNITEDEDIIAIIGNNPIFKEVFDKAINGDSATTENFPEKIAYPPPRVSNGKSYYGFSDSDTTEHVSEKIAYPQQRASNGRSHSCDSSGYTTVGNSSESELSPGTVVNSPVGSPRDGFSSNHPSPQSEHSSGISSIGSPWPNMGDYLDNPKNTYTDIWVHGINRSIMKEPKATPCSLPPICPKPPAGKVDPNSAKSKLLPKLDTDLKLRTWAKMQTYPREFFLSGDDVDGDTQLMILVSNKCDAQLEWIYSMVERMRNIPNSLSVVNRSGHSAFYLACCEMKHEPIVPVYIAEALLEQNIDLTKLTYDSGKTIPEILELKGDSHKEILKELLNLKKSNGQYVFHSYRSDINGNV